MVEHFENAVITRFQGRASVSSVVESDGFRNQRPASNRLAGRESNHVLTAEK